MIDEFGGDVEGVEEEEEDESLFFIGSEEDFFLREEEETFFLIGAVGSKSSCDLDNIEPASGDGEEEEETAAAAAASSSESFSKKENLPAILSETFLSVSLSSPAGRATRAF